MLNHVTFHRILKSWQRDAIDCIIGIDCDNKTVKRGGDVLRSMMRDQPRHICPSSGLNLSPPKRVASSSQLRRRLSFLEGRWVGTVCNV